MQALAYTTYGARHWTQADIEACVDAVINARDEGADEEQVLVEAAWSRRLTLDSNVVLQIKQAVHVRWFGEPAAAPL